MKKCKYLMILNTKFCRLKGQENPKCENCQAKDLSSVSSAGMSESSGLRRLKIW